jgi:hypothetical protein
MTAARLFVALLLLASGPAAAQFQDSYLIEPVSPVDSLPTRVSFHITSYTALAYTTPRVSRNGQTIRITTEYGFGNCPILCDYWPVLVTADLGVLPAGTYTVELWVDALHPDNGHIAAALAQTETLLVAPGPRLTFTPAHPIAGEEVELRIDSVFGRCPSAGTPTLVGDHVIEVPLQLAGCADPPAAVTLEVPLGTLAPGDYQVLVKDGQVAAQGELEVLPATAILQNGRFEVEATWQTAAGENGNARLVQLPSADSALFYFFNRSNWELMVKVLDGCAINGHYWVFAAASTDVAFEVTVKEEGGRTFEIGNRLGQPAAAINSITAFSCP